MKTGSFNLSAKEEVLMKFAAMIPIKVFRESDKGFGRFIPSKDVKEFIKRRLDFVWSPNKNPWVQIDKFLDELKKEAGEELSK